MTARTLPRAAAALCALLLLAAALLSIAAAVGPLALLPLLVGRTPPQPNVSTSPGTFPADTGKRSTP